MVWGARGEEQIYFFSSAVELRAQRSASLRVAWYFCVEDFLIMTCINMRESPHFLLSLQWDTGSHSPAWGFIASEAWIPRSSPKPICKYLPFLVQQHKDRSESTSYIVPESTACFYCSLHLAFTVNSVHLGLWSLKRSILNWFIFSFLLGLYPWNVFFF